MPLFHIGGIMRNILSPILSGGSVVACSGFDPLLFWDILYSSQKVTWYYAAPTMHHALLQEATRRPFPLPVDNIRFIANAAGGLLPVLAQGLRDPFKATILTSYGMTEWFDLFLIFLICQYANFFSTSKLCFGPNRNVRYCRWS